MRSYAELEKALLEGEAHAAWGPPIVCARVESAGGEVALRAVRYGALTYRSVLLCRSDRDVNLKRLGYAGLPRLRAAWVNAYSMGGYILPRHHLRQLGLDLAETLGEERFLGSYHACFEAVLNGAADITASYATRRGFGHVNLCGARATELRMLAYSDECPNDGVVLSPRLSADQRRAHQQAFQYLIADPRSLEALCQTFDVNGFDRPPPGTYSPLRALL